MRVNGENMVEKILYDSLKSEVDNYQQKMKRVGEILQCGLMNQSENKYLREIQNVLSFAEGKELMLFDDISIPNLRAAEDSIELSNINSKCGTSSVSSEVEAKTREISKLHKEIASLK